MALSEDERETIADIQSKVDDTHTKVTTLFERSVQQEKRMDRSDRRAGFIAGIIGTLIAGVATLVRGD